MRDFVGSENFALIIVRVSLRVFSDFLLCFTNFVQNFDNINKKAYLFSQVIKGSFRILLSFSS